MKLTIFNLKGGQGKTTLALALAFEYGFYVVANDEYSPIDKVLPVGRTKHLKENEPLPITPKEIDLIYDFGGWVDNRLVKAIEASDRIIIPIVYSSALDMQTTIKTIREVEQYNKNIIIVVNKTKKGDYDRALSILNKFFSYKALELKESTVFSNMVNSKKGIRELMNDSHLFKYHYSTPLKQIEGIYNAIRV